MKCIYSSMLLIFSLLLFHHPLDAQGPPIITDTPILLGLEGRAIMGRSMIMRSTTLYRDGEKIQDPMQREVTATVFPIGIPYNITPNLLVGVMAPVMNVTMRTTAEEMRSAGLGDVSLFAKYLLIQHDRLQETFRIAGKASVKLPTGNEETSPPLGSGHTTRRSGLYPDGSAGGSDSTAIFHTCSKDLSTG